MNMNIADISNELVYRTYLINKDRIWEKLSDLSIIEYVALHRISEVGQKEDRTYFKDLSDSMKITERQVSKLTGELRDSGLILWSYEGDGSRGTYITITDAGQMLLEKNEKLLRDYFVRVIDRFGAGNVSELLRLMKQLEEIMETEFSNGG